MCTVYRIPLILLFENVISITKVEYQLYVINLHLEVLLYIYVAILLIYKCNYMEFINNVSIQNDKY